MKMERDIYEEQAEEMPKNYKEQVRRQQTEMQSRMMRQEEEKQRRQNGYRVWHVEQLNSLLDPHDRGFRGFRSLSLIRNNVEGFRGNNPNPLDNNGDGNNNNGGGNGPNDPSNQQDFGFNIDGNQNQKSGNKGNRGAQRGRGSAAIKNPWEFRRRF